MSDQHLNKKSFCFGTLHGKKSVAYFEQAPAQKAVFKKNNFQTASREQAPAHSKQN